MKEMKLRRMETNYFETNEDGFEKKVLQKRFEDRAAIFGSCHAEDRFFGDYKNRYPKYIDEIFDDMHGRVDKDDLLFIYQHAKAQGLMDAACEFGLDVEAIEKAYSGQFNFEYQGLYYEFFGDDGCGYF